MNNLNVARNNYINFDYHSRVQMMYRRYGNQENLPPDSPIHQRIHQFVLGFWNYYRIQYLNALFQHARENRVMVLDQNQIGENFRQRKNEKGNN